jgi:hypothetical protein
MIKPVVKKIVWVASTILLLLVVGWFIKPLVTHCANQIDLSVKVIKVDGGWGYEIAQGKKVIISQPYLPAMPGRVAFKSESDAEKIGSLVVEKLKTGQNPSVTPEELKQNHIVISNQ